MTNSINFAINETNRRRAKQVAYNTEHGIEPVSIVKAVRDLTDQLGGKAQAAARGEHPVSPTQMPKDELKRLISELEIKMKQAAKDLEFEKAAVLRDEIFELRGVLADESHAPPWERVRYLTGEE